MGGSFGRFLKRLFVKEEVRLLMVGLDAAGKTTILFKMRLGEVVTTIPTIGFNVETVQYKNIRFNVWDVGGQDRLRPLWHHYYQNSSGILFVVDSNDRERLEIAKKELEKVMAADELRSVPLVVLCNKQDLPHAMSPNQMVQGLGLHKLHQPWYVQGTCATTGEGLTEALDWMSKEIAK